MNPMHPMTSIAASDLPALRNCLQAALGAGPGRIPNYLSIAVSVPAVPAVPASVSERLKSWMRSVLKSSCIGRGL